MYDSNGELYFNMLFPTMNSIRIIDEFNQGVPCYVLQTFIFTEVSITNHNEISYFLPIELVGGSNASDINNTDHYYYNFNGHNVILEAEIFGVE
ncbi:hypothetical protein KQ51_01545 [Candidatus Izimaplasma bacterium HR1]|jgi:hypothetical protein|uniref:hypothetical protein n=1 Tax=Candidatus Izimoplasma sp. HR1 TaxID=1541959 RepID=UPI0004F6BF86|nr:hypothetical protein KQ51_01545 [Candidatus Izimaplasma bacterium HR1]